MKLHRRSFLYTAAGAAAMSATPQLARALDYPARPVRVLVGYTAGSAPDVLGRLMAQWLSQRLGQPFVIENRPGAGTNIATETVVHASPDGYTLLVAGIPSIISSLLYQNLSFNFIRDIAPAGCIGGTPFVMVVNPSFPARTVAEFIAYAKANPGQINMASQGTGTLTHVAGELFKMLTNVDMVHVPYHGELEAQTDLISGRAQVMFEPIITSLATVRDGKLRALGVTTTARLDALPDVPAIGEVVPGYEVEGWLGIGAPNGTAAEAIDTLNRAINAGLADAKTRTSLVDLGDVPTALTSAEYRKLIADEYDKWAKVFKFAGIKAG
jgi:tripartite-type tricarboxylate transporter receptor subunit TctC